MKKYGEGDIFVIPMNNGMNAMCQIIWAPKGDYKNIFSFCVLKIQKDKAFDKNSNQDAISLKDNDKEIKVIFTSVKKLANGEWDIIDNSEISEKNDTLKIFNLSGDLHYGEEVRKRISVNEYTSYTSMSVLGYELIQNILMAVNIKHKDEFIR